MDVLHAGMDLENRILSGCYGPSGSLFLSVRQLAAEIPCSYVTAAKTAEWLRQRGVIMNSKHKSFITTGRCDASSELEKLLLKNRRPCFSVIFNSLGNQYYNMMSEHLFRILQEKSYDMLIMMNDSDRELEAKQLEQTLEMGLSGVFFFPHYKFKNINLYEHFPLPVIAIGRQINRFQRRTVTVDNYAVGKMAAKHLIDCGYTEFIYAGPAIIRPMMDLRLKGFSDCLKQEGYILPSDHVWQVELHSSSDDLHTFVPVLQALPQKTGIFCYHDLIAVTLLQHCVKNGIAVPNHIGIVGCDDLPITAFTVPKLSTIHYPYSHICRTAIDLMLTELEGNLPSKRLVSVQPRLIHRQSTIPF